jgi:uncharacterized OsmC-like protein
MGVKISGKYLGELAMQMTHELSGATVTTDPPLDNGGRGASFSPTDLVATALGACMMSVMTLEAKKKDWDLTGMSCDLEKHMSADLPRRIRQIDVTIKMPRSLESEARKTLENIAHNCPVAHSLKDALKVNCQFAYA